MKAWPSVLAVALAAAACSTEPQQDEEFAALAAQYIEELAERYPETATSLGDHRFDGSLNDYSAEAVGSGLEWDRQFLARLQEIDPALLGEANAVDYEILRNHLEYSIWSAEELREHEWNAMRYGVGNALYSLLAREFAPLEERLASLADRLKGVPTVVSAARTNLTDPTVVHTETALRQNAGTVALLQTGLDEFLAEAPEMAEGMAPAREAAIRALEEYGEWLRDELLPSASRDFRIGEQKLRKKLAYTLHSDLSMEEILRRAERRLAELQDEMYETAVGLLSEEPPQDLLDRLASAPDQLLAADRPEVIRTVLAALADEHPTDVSIVEDAKRALADVTDFTRDQRLVTVPDEPIQVIVMPEFRRGVSTAYCDSPGPLEVNGETFYAISPTPADWSEQRKLSFYREYNDYMLQDLTVHEAVPGHYLQLAHSNRLEAPTMVRSVFSSGTFIEGWAVYSEQVMVEHGFGGPRFKMQQLKMLTRAVINAILDQKIHAGPMTEQEAMDLMMGQGYQEEGEAAGKWIRAQLTSAQLSTYFVGISEHNDIRDAWIQRHGPVSDWQEYHDRVLSFGSPPPKFVRGLLGL